MMEGAGAFMGLLMLVAGIFLIGLAILWFLLPFAVFGIKERLDRSEKLQVEILDELRRVNAERGVSS